MIVRVIVANEREGGNAKKAALGLRLEVVIDLYDSDLDVVFHLRETMSVPG